MRILSLSARRHRDRWRSPRHPSPKPRRKRSPRPPTSRDDTERERRDHRHRDQARVAGPGRALLDQRADRRKTSSAPTPRRIEDISRNVAGLAVQNLGPGQSQVSVRGVSAGQIVRDQPGVKEQVGVYLDESVISLSLFTPDFDLFDLNRVETLRGPQGTLFGSGIGRRHASATSPTSRALGRHRRPGRRQHQHGRRRRHRRPPKGAINLPLGDTVAVRAVGYGTKFAGLHRRARAGRRQERQ